MRNAIFLSAVLTLPIYPQIVSVGAVAGTNITNDVSSLGGGGRNTIPGATQTLLTDPGGRRLIIGLKLELRLPQNWGIEVNALHRKVQLTTTTIFSPPISRPDGSQFSILGPFTTTLTSWEFPVLAKYRLPIPKLQPFLTAGPSFRPGGTSLSQIGVTAGGGVAFQTGSLHIEPTLRYTRWSASNRYPIGGPNVNQVELLVGLDSPSREQGVRAFGRPLSVGLIAGVGLGADFKARNSFFTLPQSNSGIYGILLEVALPKNLAIEGDGLYRPLHGSTLQGSSRVQFAHLTWEFPVLLKYRFPTVRTLRPFAEAGPSFRAEGNLNIRSVSHYGATVGAGVEWKLRRFRISPTFRYTGWAGKNDSSVDRTATNQAHLLVPFAF